MRAKRPCQVSSPGPRPMDHPWDSLAPAPAPPCLPRQPHPNPAPISIHALADQDQFEMDI